MCRVGDHSENRVIKMHWDELCSYWERMFGRRELIKVGEAATFLGFKDARSVKKQIGHGLIKPTILRDGSLRIHKTELFKFIQTEF